MNIKFLLTIDNLKMAPSNVIKELEAANENDLYLSALRVQNDLNIGENIQYLSGNAKWMAAKTVLDLGCGPGDLVIHLSTHFVDKFYTGVDVSENFISIAKKQAGRSTNRVFYHADLYEFAQGRYDFVILRAVLQHLKDPARFMKHLPNLLQDRAAVLFLDTTKDNFVDADPAIATFDDFYNRLEAIQKDHTGSRDCIAELEGQLAIFGFKLIEAHDQTISITTAADKAKVVGYLILGCMIAKKMMSIPIELKDLFADLIRWHDTKNSHLNLKGRLMLIEKA